MRWGFWCCAPAHGEEPKKVYATPASSPKNSDEARSSRGHQAADAHRGAGDGRAGGASADNTPSAGAKKPQQEVVLPQAEQDAETQSARSSRSAKSVRSQGTSSNISVTSEFIQGCIPARQREASRIQQAMKGFVRSMVRGQQMDVIAPDGQLCTCQCSMDKRLKYFVIELKGSERRIALSSITEVFQGKEPEDIDTPLDERCSTLMLERGDCISFHFLDVSAREHFATCLQILIDGQQ
mmetsp:Transcript_52426/g.140325  ORF Transcript_52426/g.140325 Transcript_52426/m.140325 type:complete len:239 (-) Transcript_52426:85-801(-)